MTLNKKNILIITFVVPYPVNDGGKIYCYGYIDQLRHYTNITLVFKINAIEQYEYVKILRNIWPEVKIIPVDMIDKKSNILNRVLGKIIKWPYNLFVVKIDNPLDQIKSFFSSWQIVDNRMFDTVKNILDKYNFDIIQVEHTNNLSLVTILPEQSKKIFVEIESQSLLLRDIFKNKFNFDTSYKNHLVQLLSSQEYSLMEKYNAIFTLNKNDQTRISKNISSDKTAIVNSPYGLLNIPEIEEDYISNFLPNKIIFLGSEMHAPNADAVKWFIEEIMSEIIIKYPDITFQITGNWSDKTKNRYARNRNVVFVGFIKNIEEFVKNSVMVVPIRIGGGGMRAKVLEGLAYGCPVLSTSLGCEGFENAEGAIRVCDTPEKFIYEIYQIINQPDAAKLMIRNGKKCIEDFFDFKKLALQRLDFYNDMISE